LSSIEPLLLGLNPKHMNNCEELSALEDVNYLLWVSTDRAKLVTISESNVDLIDIFSSQVVNVKLTRHSQTTKAQNMYMKELKSQYETTKFKVSTGKTSRPPYTLLWHIIG